MKVFVNQPHENWICDRMAQELRQHCSWVTIDLKKADCVWLLADWAWKQIPLSVLQSKKVVTTVHHLVPSKFDRADWEARDAVTTWYHVFNKHTLDQVRPLTSKPVHGISYWCNPDIWNLGSRKLSERKVEIGHSWPSRKAERRFCNDLPQDAYIVCSFQRDTEGHDLVSPKLEKGPDILCDFLERFVKVQPNLHVLLAGWRRQYVIRRLEAASVAHTYVEMPSQPVLNELYQTLDEYIVSARWEGGPQALLECGLIGVPCRSTPVGIAEQVLPPSAINDDLMLAVPHVPDVRGLELPGQFKAFKRMFQRITK